MRYVRGFCRTGVGIRMKASRPISGKKMGIADAFQRLRPMLATESAVPSETRQFAFEFNQNGVRTLCYHDGAKIFLQNSDGNDVTGQYPELADLVRVLGRRRVIFDGQIVLLDKSGRLNSQGLRRRLRTDHPSFALVEEFPVRFIIFDILFDRGRWILNLPLKERLARLDRYKLNGLFWRTAKHQLGNGQMMFHVARQQNFTGAVAKQLASIYQPGQRSRDWLRIRLEK
jgi:bifunctional non-homologous end joining protein LigD